MSFANSLRDGDFELNAVDKLCHWFLAFDHIIVMWFSVLFDIFVVQRSIFIFYLMDQSHEHSNR